MHFAREATASTNSVIGVLDQAVDYALANDARVLSISDGTLPDRLTDNEVAMIEASMKRAEDAGMVVVASAGNDGREVVRQPAAIDSVLAVGATAPDGQPSASGIDDICFSPGGRDGIRSHSKCDRVQKTRC